MENLYDNHYEVAGDSGLKHSVSSGAVWRDSCGATLANILFCFTLKYMY